jgi:site-specific DNA-methyltransferase (adenine-specific)
MTAPQERSAFYCDDAVTLHHGNSLDVLRDLPDNSIDSICTDPPYGLSKEPDIAEVLTHWLAGDDYVHTGSGFMGKTWDSFVPGPSVWREAFRVLKPGGYGVVFSASRTYDLMTVALRLAGFEVKDSIHWTYSQGWPKSVDIETALTKHKDATAAQAAQWAGYGTALKPSHELITLVRKPLTGTIAANVLAHGVGALNIDACRVRPATPVTPEDAAKRSRAGEASAQRRYTSAGGTNFAATPGPRGGDPKGRFPTNTVLTHDPACGRETRTCVPACPAAVLDSQSGTLKSGANNTVRGGSNNGAAYGAESRAPGTALIAYGDEGGGSRFFPSFHPDEPQDLFEAALAVHADDMVEFAADSHALDGDWTGQVDAFAADEDLDWDEPTLPVETGDYVPFMYAKKAKGAKERLTVYVPAPACRPDRNGCAPDPHDPATPPDDAASARPRDCTCGTAWVPYQHPTVKPLGGTNGDGLMPWLLSLVTPKGGTALDLYAGTGTTALAAARNGYRALVIERDPVHVFMTRERLRSAADEGPLKAARRAERAGKPRPATTAVAVPDGSGPSAPADDVTDLFTFSTSEDPAA